MGQEGDQSLTVIRAYIGVGPVDFGMTLDEVIARLGPPEARQDHWGPRPVLFYGPGAGFSVRFDEELRVNYVEVLDGSAVVDGIRLTGSYTAVQAALAARGHAARIECDADEVPTGSRFVPSLGIVLWSEALDPPGNDVIDTAGGWRRDSFQAEFCRSDINAKT